MLPQLDQRILSALSREDDDAEGGDEEKLDGVRPSHISIMKDLIAKDRNWTLLFKSLRLRPGPDGVINVYAFEKHVQSFRLIGCRQIWPALILWIWDYGNKLDAVNLKQRLSNGCARTHNQRRRIENMLRRRALFLAGAKAPSDQEFMAKSLPFASPEGADLETEHVDATSSSCSTTLETTTSSEETGLAPRTMGTNYGQRTLDDMVEGLNLGALDISRPQLWLVRDLEDGGTLRPFFQLRAGQHGYARVHNHERCHIRIMEFSSYESMRWHLYRGQMVDWTTRPRRHVSV